MADIIGTPGNDILEGTGDADVIDGGAGSDQMNGGAGDDAYFVDDAGDSITEVFDGGNDRLFAYTSFRLTTNAFVETMFPASWLSISSLNLTGNGLMQTIFGNEGDNVLDGAGGNDVLVGQGGNDTLIGGAGADQMEGGTGDDTFYVDNALDTALELAGGGYDTLYTSLSHTLVAGSSIELLSAASFTATTALSLTGNELDNLLYGNNGQNTLRGGGGADVLVGLGGDDTYYVDSADDYVVEAVNGGSDRVYTSVSYALLAGQQIENLVATNILGTTAQDFTGNDIAQAIYGSAGNNVIDGRGGADYMFGFEGNDTYYVDNTGDMLFDTSGVDTVRTSVSYTTSSTYEILLTSDWNATNAINLHGIGAREIYGNEGANTLWGGVVMAGMGGADTYKFAQQAGSQPASTALLGFVSGVDHIELDDALFPGLQAGTLTDAQFRIGTFAQDEDDRVIYDPQTGALSFDADGFGGASAVQFATVYADISGGHSILAASDFFGI